MSADISAGSAVASLLSPLIASMSAQLERRSCAGEEEGLVVCLHDLLSWR
jgi:hypothetical protein